MVLNQQKTMDVKMKSDPISVPRSLNSLIEEDNTDMKSTPASEQLNWEDNSGWQIKDGKATFNGES